MSNHESRPDGAGIREPAEGGTILPAESPEAAAPSNGPAAGSPEDNSSPPAAWQPLTFSGVAAFAHARIGRLLAAQTIVALLVAAAVMWFLQHAWYPRILESIRLLPATGAIENRVLNTPRQTREPLAADGFLALAVNLDGSPSLASASDLRVEFHRSHLSVCSLLGCLTIDYPAGYLIQFNQPELESWWGAWRLAILAGVGAATVVVLFVSWLPLAVIYAVPVWLAGVFQDRQLSLFGSWKLAAAALLAPALMMAAAIVVYGLNGVDLLRLLVLWIAHLPLGWAYLYFALRRVPKEAGVETRPPNPFEGPAAKKAGKRPVSKNPFAS